MDRPIPIPTSFDNHFTAGDGPASPQALAMTTTKPRVLLIDIGGSNVKAMVSGSEEMRRFPSDRTLSATGMVEGVHKLTGDWRYDRVSIGFPGLVRDGAPVREPLNLGDGWLGFDFEKAFGAPVRIINDSALHALAAYQGGRMLFIGFGTSIGCGLVADGAITTMEPGLIPLKSGQPYMERLCKSSLKERGTKRWSRVALEAITLLRDVFWAEDVVIGGGNAKHIDPFPENCRRVSNRNALRGAERLWPGSEMLAEPNGSTWRIKEMDPLPKADQAAVG
ncbi:MAG TPA: ROK family protein [Chthoniobacteraceae bacterium]